MNIQAHSCCLPDEDATIALGAALARLTGGHGVLTLRGNLGSGKTTLSRGLIRALGHKGAVKSPTFTLVEPYELADCRIYHYDLYRLADPDEVEYLGMRDFIDAQTLTLIEWPEKAGALLPPVDLDLELTIHNDGRKAIWSARSAYGEQLATGLDSLYSAAEAPK